TGELSDLVHHCRTQLVVADPDIVLLTDFGNDKAKPHAARGDAAVFLPRLFFGRSFVLESAVLLLQVVLDLRPDVGELLLYEARRRLEFVTIIELVEQRALEPLARSKRMLARDAILHGVFEFRQRLHAERFGKLVVDCDLARRFDRLDGDREGGVLAG